MKIAITTTVGNLDSPFDPRFGRAANFVIVDTETEEWEAYPNPALTARELLIRYQMSQLEQVSARTSPGYHTPRGRR